jgi:hypothetical protein
MTWAYVVGAGDENRTRTISLGSCTVPAAQGADLATLGAGSTRGRPLITLADGTAISRRSAVQRVLVLPSHLARSPLVLHDVLVAHAVRRDPLVCAVHRVTLQHVGRLARRREQRVSGDAQVAVSRDEAERVTEVAPVLELRRAYETRRDATSSGWQLTTT